VYYWWNGNLLLNPIFRQKYPKLKAIPSKRAGTLEGRYKREKAEKSERGNLKQKS